MEENVHDISEAQAAAFRACSALLQVFDPDLSGQQRRNLLQLAVDHAMEAMGLPNEQRPDAALLCDNWELITDASEA
jgi:hypothetical protein